MSSVSTGSLKVGELGPYILLEHIAVGGMAEIYLAKTRGVAGFEKFLCLKVIHPNYADDENFIGMLIDEAKIAVGLNHVNIVQIFDLGRDGKTYFIAMEYIDGADLFKVMRNLSERDIDVPIATAVYIAQEICTGLDYAHRKKDERGRPLNIIHRDISPQNILLSFSGEVKIVDFGIAKAASRSRKTQAGVIKGKYYYMSPEQSWGDPVDQRSDIFSAGILLYEVLTGQMLYLEEDMHRLLDMVRKADIPSPILKRPDIPPQLEHVVMKALAKKPADRWQSAQDFQSALTNFLYSYAPAYTPHKMVTLLERALEAPVAVVSPEKKHHTQQVHEHEIMSRVDFKPPTEHSVLFKLDGLSGAPLSLGDSELDELAGEQTVVSAPPVMMGLAMASKVGGAHTYEGDDGPTRVSRDPFLPPITDFEERPRRPSHAVEIVLPPSALSQPASSDLTPTPLIEPRFPSPPEPSQIDSAGITPPMDWNVPQQSSRSPSGRDLTATLPPLPPRPASQPPPIPPQITSLPPPAWNASASGQPSFPNPRDPFAMQPASTPQNSPYGSTYPLNAGPHPVQHQNQLQNMLAPASLPAQGQPWNSPARPAAPQIPVTNFPSANGWGGQIAVPLPGQQPASLSGSDISNPTLASPFLADTYDVNNDRKRRIRRRRLLVFTVLFLSFFGATGVLIYLLRPMGDDGGQINVVSVPEGGTVIIDGKTLGKAAPVTIQVANTKDAHTVEVQLANYEVYKRDVVFKENNRITVLAVLTQIFGKLTVDSDPTGANIYIDGEHQGTTPATIDNLTPNGEITVELRKRGYKPDSQVLKWADQTALVHKVTLKRSY